MTTVNVTTKNIDITIATDSLRAGEYAIVNEGTYMGHLLLCLHDLDSMNKWPYRFWNITTNYGLNPFNTKCTPISQLEINAIKKAQ